MNQKNRERHYWTLKLCWVEKRNDGKVRNVVYGHTGVLISLATAKRESKSIFLAHKQVPFSRFRLKKTASTLLMC